MRLRRVEKAQLLQVGDDLPACFEPVEPAVARRAVLVDLRTEREHRQHGQAVALADRVVVEVVRRRDLDDAGAEFAVDVVVGDDRQLAPAARTRRGDQLGRAHRLAVEDEVVGRRRFAGQRQQDLAADQRRVAFVLGMHHDGRIAEHRLGPRRGDRDEAASVGQRIADVPELAVFLFADDLEVRDGGQQLRVPVDQPLAPVDQSLLVQLHEDLLDDLRELRVHREVFERPVGRSAHPSHLARDRRARLLLPLPDALDELLPPEIVARDPLRVELAFDDDLRRDAGMVGAWVEQGVGVEFERVGPAGHLPAKMRMNELLEEAVRARDLREMQKIFAWSLAHIDQTHSWETDDTVLRSSLA